MINLIKSNVFYMILIFLLAFIFSVIFSIFNILPENRNILCVFLSLTLSSLIREKLRNCKETF